MENQSGQEQNRENMPISLKIVDLVYEVCTGCKGEFTKLLIRGLCSDCQESERYHRELEEKRKERIISCVGKKGFDEFTFEKFEQGFANLEAYKTCLNFNPKKDNIYLWGSCGTGKTHLAASVWRKFSGQFIRHPELNRLFRKLDANVEISLLEKFRDFEVVAVDDLGVGKSTEFANQILYEILDMRIMNYKNGLILTCNLSLEDFSKKVGDDRLVSRIAGICKVIKIDSFDWRLKK